jgi:hypothetical protein
MDILEKLFGTAAKVKIMRLFLFNPEYVFSVDEITTRGKMMNKEVKNELPDLIKVGLIKKKPFVKDVVIVKKKKTVTKRIKGIGYSLDPKFPYLNALKTLLISVSLHSHDDIAKVKAEARAKAIADAQTKAKELARQLGVRIVRITSFYDSSDQPMYYGRGEGVSVDMMSAKVASPMAPQIPIGEDKIMSNVTISYEIK